MPLEQRFHDGERGALLDLVGRPLTRKQALSTASQAMRQRHVTGLVGGHSEREPAQNRLHGIEIRRLRVDRREAEVARPGDPRFEALEAPYRLVARAVDLGVARNLDPGGGQSLGHQSVASIFRTAHGRSRRRPRGRCDLRLRPLLRCRR